MFYYEAFEKKNKHVLKQNCLKKRGCFSLQETLSDVHRNNFIV